ncbi:MAG: hypothetical protein LUD69_07650 [Oscillospiraceae bacterium]|nr:hypothetical protein [Oscillospiraceae bacterium]
MQAVINLLLTTKNHALLVFYLKSTLSECTPKSGNQLDTGNIPGGLVVEIQKTGETTLFVNRYWQYHRMQPDSLTLDRPTSLAASCVKGAIGARFTLDTGSGRRYHPGHGLMKTVTRTEARSF